MQSTEAFLIRQQKALLSDFHGSGLCLTALSPEKLALIQEYESWRIDTLPNRKISNVFVVHKPTGRDPECWVRWNYRGYRKAFGLFVQKYFPDFKTVLNASVQVDHLEPQTRFTRGDNYFVRLVLVRREVNLAHGAGYERCFYQSENKKELRGAIHISWLTYCKPLGILLPGKNAGASAWDTWAREHAWKFKSTSSELPADAYAGLLDVLRLGYTGYYAGERKAISTEHMIRDF